MTYVLGLTGGIASGKSTVSDMFRNKGIPVICADNIVHTLYEKEAQPYTAYPQILKLFGDDILNHTGDIDRKKVSQALLKDKDKLTGLEQILHPLVRKSVKSEILQYKESNTPLIVLDIPLLFNSSYWAKMCDSVAVTLCDTTLRKQRAFERGTLTEEKWNLITSQQLSDNEFKEKADYLIFTDTDIHSTEQTVNKITDDIQSRFI